MADKDPSELIYATHPGIEGVAQVPRSALDHMDGKWTELTDPERSPKFRKAAESDATVALAVNTPDVKENP